MPSQDRPFWDITGVTTAALGGVTLAAVTLYMIYHNRKYPGKWSPDFQDPCEGRKDYSSPSPIERWKEEEDWLAMTAAKENPATQSQQPKSDSPKKSENSDNSSVPQITREDNRVLDNTINE
ncbi:hypothetical protein GE061_016850 [Apolygus lucorum]|uniref:Uncharacterized protein n=1 Tax=Apolygus lucorum TaxID=248454 RepID=A0A6A4JVB5_APOLU|nr:hypothetical protein GE061_016850 [Apolygus lucorum]